MRPSAEQSLAPCDQPCGLAPAKGFGQDHQIGLEIVVLEPKQAPGSPEAREHLVYDQRNTMRLGRLCKSAQPVGICLSQSSGGLNGFDYDASDLLRHAPCSVPPRLRGVWEG